MPHSCFINNYFVESLRAWTANIDIKPVFNHHKAVTYLCGYYSKAENETLEAMKQAARESFISEKSAINEIYCKDLYFKARMFSARSSILHNVRAMVMKSVFSSYFWEQ